MHIDSQQSRRAFMRRSAQLGAAGVAAPFVSSLGLIGEAAAATQGSGYKALVCIFLYGGNDYFNTVAPYDGDSHAAYLTARPNIALSRASLAATALSPANDLKGLQFALNPALRPLHPLFAQGKLAPLLNVGALVEPTTQANYRSVRLPPKLFSHSDQQSFVQSFKPEGASTGWGGRMGDMLQASNGTAALTCISLNGQSLWLSGQNVTPYTATADGVPKLAWTRNRVYNSGAVADVLQYLLTNQDQKSWIAEEYTKVVNRSLQLSETVEAALARAPASQFTTFRSSYKLSQQLKMVARLIAAGPSLGLKRQVFFLGQGGYDMHSGLPDRHPALLGELSAAMSEFYAATVEHGVQNQVTTFTASDFGRALGDNGDGSDHGWGGVQFVMGGAVKGGRIYGTPPGIGLYTRDYVVGGRLIPTTSIDQLAATLALWFGVPVADLPTIMPNLGNFNPSSWDMGIV